MGVCFKFNECYIIVKCFLMICVFYKLIECKKADTVIRIEHENGLSAFGIDWTEILKHISLKDLNNKWKEANVTEDLYHAVERYKSIYKVDFQVKILSETVKSAPNQNSDQTNIDIKNIDYTLLQKNRPDNLCVDYTEVKNQFLYYFGKIIQGQPITHRDIFFSKSAFYGSISTMLTKNLKFMSFVTSDYVISTFTTYGKFGTEQTLTLVFGRSDKLPDLKGPFTYANLVHASNYNHSLAIVTSYDNFASFSPLFYPNLTAVFKNAVSEPLSVYTRQIMGKVVNLEIDGECAASSFNTPIIVTLFEIGIAHYKFINDVIVGSVCLDLNWLIDSLHGLYLLQDTVSMCYKDTQVTGLRVAGLELIASDLVVNLNVARLTKLAINDYEKWLKIAVVAFNRKNTYNKNIVNDIVSGVVQTTLSLYNKHNQLEQLSDRELYILSVASYMIRHVQYNTTMLKDLQLYHLLLTCFCSSIEIGRMLDVMAMAFISQYDGLNWIVNDGVDLMTFGDLLPPCLSSIRFDLNKEKLRQQAYQTSKYSTSELVSAIESFESRLRGRQSQWVNNVLPLTKCVKDKDNTVAYIPLSNVTYVITKTNNVEANIMYEITNTFLKNEMYIFAIMESDCPANYARDSTSIMSVYNMTTPRLCALCGSIIVTYDEQSGLENLLYVTTHEIQDQVFGDDSKYFNFDNLHTHYLLLMGNGTVIEIRGIYKRRAITALIFIMYFISLIVAAYIGYKIIMYSI